MQTVKAKKHLGQHFLNDETIAINIVNALLNEDSTSTIIEIGPGMGVLTKHLINSNVKFKALDVDEESINYLKLNYPNNAKNFLLIDFLKEDFNEKDSYNIIGNFPYNISSQIMFKVLKHKNQINIVVGMFQKEVAERIAEKPGSKTYGILSVLLQAYYDIEYLFTVHENVFTPPPKVKSAVIKLKRNTINKLNCNEELFVKVVKSCFNQRRKMIRNSVQALLQNKTAQHPLFTLRPEQLSVTQFVELTNFVELNLPHN